MNHPKQILFPQWSCRNHAELPFSESRATWPNCFRWESHVLSKTWTCHIISQNSWRIKFYWWWCQILKRYLIVICNSVTCDFEIWNQTESVRLIPWSCVSYDSIVNITISSIISSLFAKKNHYIILFHDLQNTYHQQCPSTSTARASRFPPVGQCQAAANGGCWGCTWRQWWQGLNEYPRFFSLAVENTCFQQISTGTSGFPSTTQRIYLLLQQLWIFGLGYLEIIRIWKVSTSRAWDPDISRRSASRTVSMVYSLFQLPAGSVVLPSPMSKESKDSGTQLTKTHQRSSNFISPTSQTKFFPGNHMGITWESHGPFSNISPTAGTPVAAPRTPHAGFTCPSGSTHVMLIPAVKRTSGRTSG